MSEFDILVAGELNPDLILSDPDLEIRFGQQEILVEQATLTIGSSNAIFACGAARLGLKVAFVGVVGNDTFGRFMLESLEARLVDVFNVVVDASQKTGFSVILNRITDRAILTHMGAINALRADHISETVLSRARHLHVASYFLQTNLQPGLAALFHRARKLGLTTSLDTNWDPAEAWVGVEELLQHTTVFLPNEAEALALTGESRLVSAVDTLNDRVPTTVVKLGAEGAYARRGRETARVRALSVEVIDTVGAGDSFDAGFIYGYLQGWDLVRSLQMGVTCGSLSTRAAGGTNAQPTLDEAMGAMVNIPPN